MELVVGIEVVDGDEVFVASLTLVWAESRVFQQMTVQTCSPEESLATILTHVVLGFAVDRLVAFEVLVTVESFRTQFTREVTRIHVLAQVAPQVASSCKPHLTEVTTISLKLD